MANYQKIAFLFPGQGAQYPGMGKDFAENYPKAKETFQEADETLQRNISETIFNGPADVLTQTKNSQVAIFVVSMAILRVMQDLFPNLQPFTTAGLSLGEYTGLSAANYLSFQQSLPLVQKRGELMHEACETTQGTMAAVLGLSAEEIENLVRDVNMPNDLWASNFNCPGQVVISGTSRGIEAGTAAAKAKGARGTIPLRVHGAFHSGLMKSAEEKLEPHIREVTLEDSSVEFVQNVSGDVAKSKDEIKENLIQQVTHSVRWEQGIKTMINHGVDLFLEIGCGKVLKGFNDKIDPSIKTINVEKVGDIDILSQSLSG